MVTGSPRGVEVAAAGNRVRRSGDGMAVRWGILGTGGIAEALVHAIRAEGGEVIAVGSADATRAEAFAATHAIPRHHAPHHALLDHDDLDVVYVATTNERHLVDAIACLDAGVPVLLEKPFALSQAEGDQILAAARRSGTFLMEAMWMRFQPGMLELERQIELGRIGPPRMVIADFGIAAPPEPDRRWFDLSQGGGALLDVGIYPVTFAVSILGEPLAMSATAEFADTGVDAQVAATMRHADGALSSWSCSFVADTGVEATVGGPEGSIRIHSPFNALPKLTYRRVGQDAEVLPFEGAGLGYRPEVQEVHRCLAEGRLASPRMPHELTRSLLGVMDELRRQIGLVYPSERV
jgi:predicted dehydrogenase